MNHPYLLQKLVQGESLLKKEAQTLLAEMLNETMSPVQTAAALTALSVKGETADEIRGFITAMQSRMQTIPHGRMVIDTCGTGGDGKRTFNISTATAILTAACGVKVAKHGNKSASSKCGSADVLEALGVNIYLKPDDAAAVLDQCGLVFLFAPLYHPSLKPLALVRKELGFRTVFNVLGPFLNPARVRRQLIGVPNKKIAKLLAEVATGLNYDHLMLVSSEEEMDEIGLNAPTKVYEVIGKTVRDFTIHPENLGIPPAPLRELAGGEAEENARIIRTVLAGEGGARRDIVVLNTAYALLVANQVQTAVQGVELARRVLDTGEAAVFLERFIEITNSYERYS
jgi:anthranilate phosphoribosyltransferase